ncbi:hypothetical protein [Streptomyces sp. NBC_00448]|uniref:hypothetical protein n=1 Tax=Streptomyces sp. NBC_00448 TaxID=2903652 RepID=UPI002E1B02DC
MDGNEAPDDGSVRLGHSGGFARPLSRLLLLACGFGMAIALAGGASLPEADGGFTELLTRTLLALGLAVVGLSCVLLAIGRWLGRPAELSAAGIRAPKWRGERRIPWSEVRDYRIHGVDKDRRRLLAVWLGPDRDGAPLWLGDVSRASVPEEEVVALVRRSTNR